jgi:hypothetical protein
VIKSCAMKRLLIGCYQASFRLLSDMCIFVRGLKFAILKRYLYGQTSIFKQVQTIVLNCLQTNMTKARVGPRCQSIDDETSKQDKATTICRDHQFGTWCNSYNIKVSTENQNKTGRFIGNICRYKQKSRYLIRRSNNDVTKVPRRQSQCTRMIQPCNPCTVGLNA